MKTADGVEFTPGMKLYTYDQYDGWVYETFYNEPPRNAESFGTLYASRKNALQGAVKYLEACIYETQMQLDAAQARLSDECSALSAARTRLEEDQ